MNAALCNQSLNEWKKDSQSLNAWQEMNSQHDNDHNHTAKITH